MPENIFKIYPPQKASSKNVQRGSGLWFNDSPKDRFEHVKKILDIYYSDVTLFDDLDLTWFLKNAVIGDIYFSKEVVDGVKNGLYWSIKSNKTISDVIDAIVRRDTHPNGVFNESLLQVRKWLGKEFHDGKALPLRFEHVIPAKVYLAKLKNLYMSTKSFTHPDSQSLFESYRKKIAVCIITKDQDDDLQLRDSMPPNWDWVTGDIFARYDYCKSKKKIVVYKQQCVLLGTSTTLSNSNKYPEK